jgi:hypothetical protein
MKIKLMFLTMILIAEVNCNLLPKIKKFLEINLKNKFSEGKASVYIDNESTISNFKTMSLVIQNTSRVEVISHTTMITDVAKIAKKTNK